MTSTKKKTITNYAEGDYNNTNECISELVRNVTKNKRRTNNRQYSNGVKQIALTMHFYTQQPYAY
jgi:hypothetical protein